MEKPEYYMMIIFSKPRKTAKLHSLKINVPQEPQENASSDQTHQQHPQTLSTSASCASWKLVLPAHAREIEIFSLTSSVETMTSSRHFISSRDALVKEALAYLYYKRKVC